tara:strand:+ start:609 stop:761 length:153 start_codon:yes stop_codon:yes gene_type:complete
MYKIVGKNPDQADLGGKLLLINQVIHPVAHVLVKSIEKSMFLVLHVDQVM